MHNSDFSSLLDEIGFELFECYNSVSPLGPSKASISRYIKQTTIVLLDVLCGVIKWPETVDGNREIALRFSKMTRFGLPNCVGAVDGTIVPIIGPNVNRFNQNSYWSRYLCYGINVLAVCDANGRFLFVSSRFPGKANDARVYNETAANKFRPPFNGAYLLGDSAYGASEKLIPMRPVPENAPIEWKRFYDSHARTRVAIECAFGRWKNKFLCLKRELRFTDPRICSSVILACAYLHNFILQTNEEEQSVMNAALNQPMPNDIEDDALAQENEPDVSQNPQERRRRGMELLNHTCELFKQMHGF